jgi:F420-dependent oxidoreductase-like protein
LDIALMIEGQDGLTWDRWQRLARAAEDLGFAGLYRSDHFTNPDLPNKDSLELWTSLTWLASHTERIEFGPLVTPASFRHPVHTARMGKDVDALSGGRLTLGVGGGWEAREHRMFGFPLLKGDGRFNRFAESVEVIHRLLRSEGPITFAGDYYQLQQAELLPPPAEPGRPPLLIGGNGRERTLPLAARWADEWNGVFIPAAMFRDLNQHLTELLGEVDRPPRAVRRSIMTNITFGRDQEDLESAAAARGSSVAALKEGANIVGVGSEVLPLIDAYRQAGAERIMLQWRQLDDLDGIAALAETVLPEFHHG